MTLFPPNPIGDGHGGVRPFEKAHYQAFQSLWKRYGIPELVALKEEVFTAEACRSAPPRDLPPPLDRAGRALMRVAQRQWQQLRSSG